MKRRSLLLSALAAATFTPNTVSAQSRNVLPPQPDYLPIPAPESNDLELRDGFRTESGFVIRFGHSFDPALNRISSKSFFCPGVNIPDLTKGYQLWEAGSKEYSTSDNTGTRTLELGISITEEDEKRSRLEGEPPKNNMTLQCPGAEAQRIDTLTPEEKRQILTLVKGGVITLMNLPDIYARPEGYVLPDGARLLILSNKTNYAEDTRANSRFFIQQPGKPAYEYNGSYHDGRSSAVKDNGRKGPGYIIESLGTLVIPSLQQRFDASRSPTPLPAGWLNGAPVAQMNDKELKDLLGLITAERKLERAPLVTPCAPHARAGSLGIS